VSRPGWLDHDPARLAASLAQFAGHPAYGTSQLRDDQARFVFLLSGGEEPLFGPAAAITAPPQNPSDADCGPTGLQR
jgi:hypothetical protein